MLTCEILPFSRLLTIWAEFCSVGNGPAAIEKKRAGGSAAFPLTRAVPPPTLNPMEVHLSPDQKAFVRQAIESGRIEVADRLIDSITERFYLLACQQSAEY
jgi:hypothetical protein